jgi:hypothetical protein
MMVDGSMLVKILFSVALLFSYSSEGSEPLSSIQESYRAGDWDHFFAKVIFFRMHNQTHISMGEADGDHILALEIMALARHCQWSLIDGLIESMGGIESDSIGPLVHKALSVVKVKKEYQSYEKDRNNSRANPILKLRESKKNWALSADKVSQLTHHEHFRVKVRSLCK